MLKIDNIERATIEVAKGNEVCFVLNKKNNYTLFLFCYYQLKHKTFKEFNCIIYNKQKDLLYYILAFVAKINAKKYTLIFKDEIKL
ncbi:MAG: hypothetical protein KJO45_06045 [Sulfurovum sp.]|nr:hypothetical protein [Sulfurovum sp.]